MYSQEVWIRLPQKSVKVTLFLASTVIKFYISRDLYYNDQKSLQALTLTTRNLYECDVIMKTVLGEAVNRFFTRPKVKSQTGQARLFSFFFYKNVMLTKFNFYNCGNKSCVVSVTFWVTFIQWCVYLICFLCNHQDAEFIWRVILAFWRRYKNRFQGIC